MPKTVYVIAGPTAVGKTTIAIQLAQQLGTSIISADSRQCYQEMTIGTAKPTPAELQQVHHYFIDEYPVTTHITAADYERLALGYLEEIFRSHDTAVVCGGTGLYIQALCDGLDDMPPIEEHIVKEVMDTYKQVGLSWLQKQVQAEDPAFFEKGEVKNPARLIRALTFIRSTGQSITAYHKGKKKSRPFRIIKIGIELPRDILYTRINNRVEDMMASGLLKEAEALYSFRHLKNLQTVGYTELFDHMDGKYTLPQAIDKIKQHTRNYAKRQLTWFKKDAEMKWYNASTIKFDEIPHK